MFQDWSLGSRETMPVPLEVGADILLVELEGPPALEVEQSENGFTKQKSHHEHFYFLEQFYFDQ